MKAVIKLQLLYAHPFYSQSRFDCRIEMISTHTNILQVGNSSFHISMYEIFKHVCKNLEKMHLKEIKKHLNRLTYTWGLAHSRKTTLFL